MHLLSEALNAFAQRFHRESQFGVLIHEFDELRRLCGRKRGALFAGPCEVFAVLCIGVGMGFVAIRLPCLGQQNQRCGVGGLQAEREIEKDEWIDIEMDEARRVQGDPCGDEEGLADQKSGRSKKPRKGLGLEREPIVPKQGRKMGMRREKATMMQFRWRRGGRSGRSGFLLHTAVLKMFRPASSHRFRERPAIWT